MTREIALTNRHEIVSPITGEEVTESFFETEIEDPLNVEEHIKTVLTYLIRDVPMNSDLVVYVTGLTPSFPSSVYCLDNEELLWTNDVIGFVSWKSNFRTL